MDSSDNVAGTQKGCARRFLRLFPNLGFRPIVLERGSTGQSIVRLRVRVYDDAVSKLGQFNSLQVCLCLSEETQKLLDLSTWYLFHGKSNILCGGGGCGVGGGVINAVPAVDYISYPNERSVNHMSQ